MSVEERAGKPAYARFTRRVQAVYVDVVVLLLIATGALIIAVAFGSDHVGRVLGFAVAITWALYEPLLVSLTGSTLGHRYCNMRVVDDRHGGNVSLPKAFARVVLKSFLGWYSFILMTTTSRHQALHDLLTKSTVQIRNQATAKPHHFAYAREPLPAGGPSRIRRVLVALVYIVVCLFVLGAIYFALVEFGLVSRRCIDHNDCSAAERWTDIILTLTWLAISAWLLGSGWRGKLWGARANQSSSPGQA